MVKPQNIQSPTYSELSFKLIRTLLCVKYRSYESKAKTAGILISMRLKVKIINNMAMTETFIKLCNAIAFSKKRKLPKDITVSIPTIIEACHFVHIFINET